MYWKQIGSIRKGITVKAATTVVSDLKDRKDIQSGKEFVGVKEQVKQLTSSASMHSKSGSTKVSGEKRKKQVAKALEGVKQTTRRIQAKTVRGGSLANNLAQGSMALELEQSNSKGLKVTQGNEKGLAPADAFPEFGNARKNFEQSEHRDAAVSLKLQNFNKIEMEKPNCSLFKLAKKGIFPQVRLNVWIVAWFIMFGAIVCRMHISGFQFTMLEHARWLLQQEFALEDFRDHVIEETVLTDDQQQVLPNHWTNQWTFVLAAAANDIKWIALKLGNVLSSPIVS
ncbi:hypothetical protein C5167_021756 [Papaver somniferum]|uniref:Uncharacterized protein n=1 Tax=Papaver somniferum TaxID=3469 RepID=A0A4Y7JIX2_PAPSO|nr:hypothetical protein C5167_021756 [Papaver somniferum]